MTLSERIKARQPAKVVELRKQPRWIERMNRGQLPAKDMTRLVDGAWTRPTDGGAA